MASKNNEKAEPIKAVQRVASTISKGSEDGNSSSRSSTSSWLDLLSSAALFRLVFIFSFRSSSVSPFFSVTFLLMPDEFLSYIPSCMMCNASFCSFYFPSIFPSFAFCLFNTVAANGSEFTILDRVVIAGVRNQC